MAASGMAWADFGIKAIMGIGAGAIADAQVNASNTINAANTYAQNLVRSANNQLGAARSSLARYNQSVGNQRILQNTGAALETDAINYRRARDSASIDDFESQLAFSEQAGAQAAAAAFSGLTGGVADIVNGTTALRKSRMQQRVNTALKQGDWDAGQRAKQILQAGWDDLDHSEISDDLDYSVNIATKQQRGGSLFTDIFGGQDMKNMANMASDTISFAKGFFKKTDNIDYLARRDN